jgi:cell division protein FtsA
MSFINKIIPSKKIILIDVWTYKVKTALCEYKNNEITVVSYAEKRQENSDIIWSEIANIEWVSDTVEKTLDRLLKDSKLNPNDIIINIPTSTIISSWKTLNYTRENFDENITIEELDYIIAKAEKEALDEAKIEIQNKTGYSEVDMKLITSSITDINIDGFRVTNPIWFTWKNINLSVLNIFIPASRYNIINTIGSFLWKNILSIIPLEFSLPKILSWSDYAYDDVIFVDVWNTKSSLIIQKNWVIIWFDKINLWINDLIKSIKEKTWETTIEIIKNIQKEDKYQKEKKEFLEVFEEWFIITLKEILKSNLVPYKILLSGWWDNNFLREHILKINLSKHTLHSIKPFSFINIDFEKDIKINWEKKVFDKTNIWLLSMIIASKEIVQYKNNPILSIIRNFLDKNEL